MTAPTGNAITAWVQTHKGPAAAGAGAVVVGALALRARSKTSTSSGTSAGAGTSNSDGSSDSTAAQGGIAGLTGDPDDYATQIENWVQDQLNQQNTQVADALTAKPAAPAKPVAPKPAPAAPKPGTVHYTIRSGDTLAHIAQEVYGTTAAWAVQAIRTANPILIHFADNAKLNYYAGDSITIANAKPPTTKKPAAPVKKKPAPKPRPKPKKK